MQDFAQLIGFIALFFAIIPYLKDNRNYMFQMFLSSQALFALHYYLLSAYTGAAMNILAFIRTYVFKIKTKNKLVSNRAWLFLFIFLFLAFGLISWEGTHSILPTIAMIIEVIALWNEKTSKIRAILFLSFPLWFTYNFIVGSYAGMITSIFIFISLLISIFRFDLKY